MSGGGGLQQRGHNPAALAALAAGIAPSMPGFLATVGLAQQAAPLFDMMYSFSWFVGFFCSAAVYLLLMRARPSPSDAQSLAVPEPAP